MNWLKKYFLLYLAFWTLENSQLGVNVTWHDAYCQQHDEIYEIKFIFNYQISYPNMKEMNDSIYSKSKPLHPINIWNNDKDNEINNSCLLQKKINIEHNDLQFDFVISIT